MADPDIPFPSALRKLKTQTLGVGNLKFFHTMHIYEMVAIFFYFFIVANADISFPKWKSSIGSVSLSPHHFIFSSVSTFKNDDVPMLMHVHSCMMTFLHLKVHNG